VSWANEYFFDLQGMHRAFPAVDPWGFISDLFCTGVFFARRGCLKLSEYQMLLQFAQHTGSLFKCGDQGILNYMVLRAWSAGEIAVGRYGEQILVNEFDVDELESRFPFPMSHLETSASAFLHWAGPKPFVFRGKSFSNLTRWRRRYSREFEGAGRLQASLSVILDDAPTIMRKVASKLRGVFRHR